MSKLVNVRKKELNKLGYNNLEHWLENPDHIYIGRYNHYVVGTYSSKWHNPFSVKKYGRSKCLELYEKYITESDLINDLDELRNKTLGCWCCPEPCHGNILLNLLKK